MPAIVSDVRRALRQFSRTPGFALPVVATLALGLGSVAAIFTIVNAVLIRPLPYAESDRIVAIHHTAPGRDIAKAGVSEGTYVHYREHGTVFEAVGAYLENSVNLMDGDQPERVPIAMITPSVLSILKVKPLHGRLFTEADFATRGGPVLVMLGYDLWVRRYNADPGIVGRVIRANSSTKLVVGVLPPGFDFPRRGTGIWYAESHAPEAPRVGDFYLKGIARLRPGVTTAMAEAELRGLLPSMIGTYKDATPDLIVRGRLQPIVTTLKAEIIGSIRLPLTILLCTMGLVLLISWANVANLFLVRGEARRREVALHRALGASSADLIRTALCESLLLAAPAAAFGLLVAHTGLMAIVESTRVPIPRLEEIRMDDTVMAVTAALTFATSALLALFTLGQARRLDLTNALKSGERQAGVSPRARLLQRGLVSAQVALALVVVIGSAVMLQSLWNMQAVDPGFASDDRLTFRYSLPFSPYPTYNDQVGFNETLIRELRATPGIAEAAIAFHLPLATHRIVTLQNAVALGDGAEGASLAGAPPRALFNLVTPGYFDAMRMRVRSGRGFDPAMQLGQHIPVVISQALADVLSPGVSPIGRPLRVLERQRHPPYVVIGVVSDVVGESLVDGPQRTVYLPVVRNGNAGLKPAYYPGDVSVVVRTQAAPEAVMPLVRDVMKRQNPLIAIAEVRTLRDMVETSLARTHLTTLLLLIAAGAGLVLALVGIAGLTAYTVSRRRREVAVRLALGARPAQVRTLILSGVVATVGTGVAIGLHGSFVLTRTLASLLFQVSPHDPLTFAIAPVLVLGVALAAGFVPARRVERIDPMRALASD